MITFEQIQSVICLGEMLLAEQLQSKSRKREIVFARQAVMFFLKRYSKETSERIGKHYNKDHATVIHALKAINNLIETDKRIFAKIAIYECRIQALVNFDNNIITDKLIEIKELLKVQIDSNMPLNFGVITIYNKLIEKYFAEEQIKNDSK